MEKSISACYGSKAAGLTQHQILAENLSYLPRQGDNPLGLAVCYRIHIFSLTLQEADVNASCASGTLDLGDVALELSSKDLGATVEDSHLVSRGRCLHCLSSQGSSNSCQSSDTLMAVLWVSWPLITILYIQSGTIGGRNINLS